MFILCKITKLIFWHILRKSVFSIQKQILRILFNVKRIRNFSGLKYTYVERRVRTISGGETMLKTNLKISLRRDNAYG